MPLKEEEKDGKQTGRATIYTGCFNAENKIATHRPQSLLPFSSSAFLS